MQRTSKATNVVLVLLCAMYFISYIVRQSVSTAMLDMRPEFNLSTTQALFVFSVFGYPYLLFQIIGGFSAVRLRPQETRLLVGCLCARRTRPCPPGRTRPASLVAQGPASDRALGSADRPHVAGNPDLFLLRLVPVALFELPTRLLQRHVPAHQQRRGDVLDRDLFHRRDREHHGR